VQKSYIQVLEDFNPIAVVGENLVVFLATKKQIDCFFNSHSTELKKKMKQLLVEMICDAKSSIYTIRTSYRPIHKNWFERLAGLKVTQSSDGRGI
jgi:hypothetical protein